MASGVMNICLWLCVIFVFMCKAETYAQIFIEPSTYVQRAKIGLVDEFIKRFNGQEAHPDVFPTAPTYRRDNLLYLFNASNSIEKKDSVLNEILSFIDTVLRDSTTLAYSEPNWFGVANCKGALSEKPVTFDLYLSVQHRYDDMYKWVIAKADGSCFNVAPKDSNEKLMLSPDSHETKFMSLGRMTKEQPYNVSLFMANGFEYDPTSAFVYLVRTNQLKIDYVDNLEFVFTQVPGYLFHVKYFERESGNSGWLIDKFYKINDNDKTDLLNSLHIKQETKDKPVNMQATTHHDDCNTNFSQEMVHKRIEEKKRLVCDYLYYAQTTDNKDERRYYLEVFKNLFSSGAGAYINDDDSSTKVKKITIEAFCDRILNKRFKGLYKIDSISVPIWKEYDGIEANPVDTANASLTVEETEDGSEIIIHLGDLFISKEE